MVRRASANQDGLLGPGAILLWGADPYENGAQDQRLDAIIPSTRRLRTRGGSAPPVAEAPGQRRTDAVDIRVRHRGTAQDRGTVQRPAGNCILDIK